MNVVIRRSETILLTSPPRKQQCDELQGNYETARTLDVCRVARLGVFI